ncbi:hypothetical protein ACFOKJ_08245 [Vogesella amnigena]|uniref:Lipoprotein n=1 Tax=Vogesella amnigena TaxID=1507449 RepID=A0ABV7TTS0_9NEIS
MRQRSHTGRLLALPLALLLLAGCASSPLAGKRADEAAVETLYRHNVAARYNFSGESRITSLQLPGKQRAELQALVQTLAGSFRLQYAGAVDLTQQRVELIPTLRFTRPHAEAWLRFPLLLQLDTLTLYVDGSAMSLLLPSLENKLVKFQLPEEKARQLPVSAVLAELPDIVRRVYAAVERQAYSFQPLTAADAQQGVAYRIRLSLDPAAGRLLSQRMATELLDSIKRHGASAEVQEVATGLLKLAEADPLQLRSESQTDLLVNRQGKLLALEESRTLSTPGEQGVSVGMLTQLNMSNEGKPVFTLQPSAANVVDYKDVSLPEWLKPSPPADEESEADAADDAGALPDDASVPAAEAPPAPAVKSAPSHKAARSTSKKARKPLLPPAK